MLGLRRPAQWLRTLDSVLDEAQGQGAIRSPCGTAAWTVNDCPI